jgi:hypothetical protein
MEVRGAPPANACAPKNPNVFGGKPKKPKWRCGTPPKTGNPGTNGNPLKAKPSTNGNPKKGGGKKGGGKNGDTNNGDATTGDPIKKRKWCRANPKNGDPKKKPKC